MSAGLEILERLTETSQEFVSQTDPQEEFALAVKKNLGYNLLYDTIHKPQVDEKLMAVFKKICLFPFKPDLVDKYKEHILIADGREKKPLFLRWFSEDSLRKAVSGDGGWLTILMVISAVVGVVATGAFFLTSGIHQTLITLAISVIVFSLLYSLGSMVSQANDYCSGRWHSTRLREYEKPIPEFVLQTALDLQTKLPEAQSLHVEWFEPGYDSERTTVSTALSGALKIFDDPFLVMKYGDKLYYMEVWNESRFKKERIK